MDDDLKAAFESVNQKFTAIGKRFDEIDIEVDTLRQDFKALDAKVDSLDAKVDFLNTKIDFFVGDMRKELRTGFDSVNRTLEFNLRTVGDRLVDHIIDHNARLAKGGL